MIRLRRHYKVRNAEAGRQRCLFLGIILREESKAVNTAGKHGVKVGSIMFNGKYYNIFIY